MPLKSGSSSPPSLWERFTRRAVKRFPGTRHILRQWTKADLINRLAQLRGYRSYLEICTATTGLRYGEIDRDILPLCHRMMYRCPPQYSDGMPVHFRSDDLDISESLRALQSQGRQYDIILVDPWHEYAASRRDLSAAVTLMSEQGAVVVHDCLPPREELADPAYLKRDWCGVTYKAYLDFVLENPHLDYRTVDIDFGCGVIQKRPAPAPPGDEHKALIEAWTAVGEDFTAAFHFMRAHPALWHVVRYGAFLRAEARGR